MSKDWYFQKPEPLAREYADVIRQALRLAVDAFELGKQDGSVQPHLDTQLTILQSVAGIHGVSDLHVRMLDEGDQLAPQLDPKVWGGLLPSSPEPSTPHTHKR